MKNLNSLQTNAHVLAQIRRNKDRHARNNLPEMRRFTERAGVKVSSPKLPNQFYAMYRSLFGVLF